MSQFQVPFLWLEQLCGEGACKKSWHPGLDAICLCRYVLRQPLAHSPLRWPSPLSTWCFQVHWLSLRVSTQTSKVQGIILVWAVPRKAVEVCNVCRGHKPGPTLQLAPKIGGGVPLCIRSSLTVFTPFLTPGKTLPRCGGNDGCRKPASSDILPKGVVL